METTKRKFRIKSRARFTAFIIILTLLLAAVTTTVLGLNNVNGLTKKAYREVEVTPGDTLWEIAAQYMPKDTDPRKSVHILCAINDTSAEQLQPGQVLKIPLD